MNSEKKISESNWSKMRKSLRANNAEYAKTLEEIKKSFSQNEKLVDEITAAVNNSNEEIKEDNPFIKMLFGDSNEREKEMESFKQHLADRKALIEEFKDDPEKQELALFMLDNKKTSKNSKQIKEENEDGLVGDLVGGAKDDLANGLSDMITDFDNFGNNFKKMGKNIANHMIKTAADALIKVVINEQAAALAIQGIRALWNFAGATLGLVSGGVGAVGSMLISALVPGSHHSGGIIPTGANVNIPGTKEQLALLKGGERILSPGENTNYGSGGSGSPIVLNNFNVKAWDSKDVSKYLLENKQLINSITAMGIKNNDEHLRTMVQNV